MLKDTSINSGTIYLGRNAGKEIYEKIKSAQHSIKVITPYISSEYIDLLKSKALDGLDVKLIVSSDIGGEKDKHKSIRKLISQKQHINQLLKAKRQKYLQYINAAFLILAIAIVIGVFYQSHYTWYAGVIFPVLLFARKKVLSIKIYTYTYYSKISLSIPMSPHTNGFDPEQTLIHAKLFIIDESIAYIGSINFTKAAFWKNYESRIKITQIGVINDLAQEFEYVFNNKNTSYLDISSMGSHIYSEPPN